MLGIPVLTLWLNIFYCTTAFRELPYIIAHKDENGDRVYEMKISQPQVKVNKADQYFCFTKFLEEIGEAYIILDMNDLGSVYAATLMSFILSIYQHLKTILYEVDVRECSKTRGKYCPGSSVSGAFVDSYSNHNTGFVKYPKDISLKIGSSTTNRYLTYETHFKVPVTEVTEYPLVNITLTFKKYPTKYNYQTHMLVAAGQIPANVDKGYFAEIACPWNKPDVLAFGVSMHTHHYGYMAEIFRIRNGTWTLLGNQLTKERPKDMYRIIGCFVDIKQGDIIAAKCFYMKKGDNPVKFGLGGGEEMCSADVSFGYKFEDEHHFKRTGACVTNLPEFSFCNHE